MYLTYTGSSALATQGQATADQVQRWIEDGAEAGAAYVELPVTQVDPGAGAAIVEFGKLWNVNWDLLAALIVHESAWLQSLICRDKRNPGGYGAENDDPYNLAITFDTLREGIRAVAAHLAGYVHGTGAWNAYSPRHSILVEKGYAGTVVVPTDLNGKWAWPGTTYGQSLARIANDLLWFAEKYPGVKEVMVISNMKDIRHRLQTSTEAPRGPLRTTANKSGGVVVHFRGVNTNPAPGYDSFAADATYHVNKNWARAGSTPVFGDGIMYHIGIGWDALKYHMRDLDRVLWHCGETARNESTLAIQLPMGQGQRATPDMIQALKEVCDEWHAARGTTRDKTWGHSEVTPTSCPGTLMEDFVRPYRAGTLGQPTPPPPADPDVLYIPANPYGQVALRAGFKAFYERIGQCNFPADPIAGAVAVLGFPTAEEYPTSFGSVQLCERAMLKWFRGASAPWDIVPALLSEGVPERVG